MSARDARDDFVESVLIAYAWPCSERVPKLPEDVMARWPPGEPLETAARVTGYICRGKMASDVRGRVYPSAATAVTFFRLQATTEQTQRFAQGVGHVKYWQAGASIVVWKELAGISFDQMRGNQLQQVGLCAHLQKLKATGVLDALQLALLVHSRRLPAGHTHKKIRRTIKRDLRELSWAKKNIDAPGGAVFGQPPPPMQPPLRTAVNLPPFHVVVANSNALPRCPPVRRVDLEGEVEESLARVAMQVGDAAREAIYSGCAIAPRLGKLLPPREAHRSHRFAANQAHPFPAHPLQQNCPETSKVLLNDADTEWPPDSASALKLSKAKNCAVWIAPLEAVQSDTGHVFSAGRVCQIVGVDERQTSLTVAPGLPWAGAGCQIEVITLVLEDLHRYFFAYEALKEARGGRINEAALKMFWGMPPPGGVGSLSDPSASAIRSIFGMAWSPEREIVISGIASWLDLEAFTPSQRAMLYYWRTNSRVECPPGCGKTLLALALCVGVLQSPVRAKLWVTQASLLQVDSFFMRLERIAAAHGVSGRVARMGRGDTWDGERFHQHVEVEASRQYVHELEMLRVLDCVMEALLRHRCVVGMEALAVYVLSLRVSLWAALHDSRRATARTIAEGVQVVVSTASMRAKFKAGLVSGWAQALLGDKTNLWGYLKDECQQGSMEETTAEILGAEFFVCFGDRQQAKEPGGVAAQPMLGGSPPGKRARLHESPLDKHNCATWLKGNPAVESFPLTGSYRLGGMAVRVLKAMYPKRHTALEARSDHDTLVLPVIFSRLAGAFHNDCGDFVSDQLLFSHAAQILAIEVLAWAAGPRKKPVLVLACHLTMLQNFVVYAHQALPRIIDDLRAKSWGHAGEDREMDFSLEALVRQRVIVFAGIQKSGGFDGSVALLLLPHRKAGDAGWQGHLKKEHLQYIMLTRASDRVYPILEDLSGEIVAPPREVKLYGLRPLSHWRSELTQEALDERMSQRHGQLPLVRLLRLAPGIYEQLGIARECLGISGLGMVTGDGVAPVLAAAGVPLPACDHRELEKNLALAQALYSRVWWRKELPEALVIKDGQSDRDTFERAFGPTNAVWRWAKRNISSATKGRKRKREESSLPPDWHQKYALSPSGSQDELELWASRALDCLTCNVISDKHFEVLMPLAKFGDGEDASRVAGALANAAVRAYQELTESTGASISIETHKKKVHDLGSYGVRVTWCCGDDRPVFVLDDPNGKFWFYAACGMQPDQSPHHQTLRGICTTVHAAASLMYAAVTCMSGFVLRANLVRDNPDSASSKAAREELLAALISLGEACGPAAPQMDLVARCKGANLEPKRLLDSTTTKELIQFVHFIAPANLLTHKLRDCVRAGQPLSMINDTLAKCPPGGAMDTIDPLGGDDQEPSPATDGEFSPGSNTQNRLSEAHAGPPWLWR